MLTSVTYSLSILSQDAVSCTRESQYLTILCEEASRADRLGSKGGFLSSVQIHIKTKKDSGQQEVLILSRYKWLGRIEKQSIHPKEHTNEIVVASSCIMFEISITVPKQSVKQCRQARRGRKSNQ